MMNGERGIMFWGVLTVILAVLHVRGSPLGNQKTDFTYQDDEEFKREIRENIEDLHKNNRRSAFDKILMVNSIHKRWKANERLAKRNLDGDGIINNVNTVDDNLLLEGDISMDNKELLDLQEVESYRRKRNAIFRRKMIWVTRTIPYYLDPGLSLKAKSVIHKAIQIVHSKTCIRWIQLSTTNQNTYQHYVHFKKGDGCFSTIGRAYAQPGPQTLSIGEGCEWVDVVLHELTHCMGFFHEQSRNDRNRYIKILWENIPVDLRDQFAMYSHGQIDKMKKDYDIKSLMHYSSTAFGVNGKTTIVSLHPGKTVGEATTYSELDIIEINALYDCKTSSAHQKMSSWSLWSECDQYCFKSRQRFCFSSNKANCPNTNAYGIETEYSKCSTSECPAPIDGNWGMWSSWSACSKSCDEGSHTRSRQCNNPAPSDNGKTCVGESTDVSVCLNRRCNIGKYDVDFEDGWGIWFSASNDGLIPWSQINTFTKTMNTGPRGDHTLQGKGSYVYVESSKRNKGDRARLVSQMLGSKTRQCFSFYYNMYGKDTGTLRLFLAPEHKPWIYLFTKTGNQGQNWHNADVTLENNGNFQLVFEVELGGTGYSDTALDDIFIDNGACPGFVCKDDNINCPHWAKIGECSKNRAYMHINCRLSCGVCTKPEVAKTEPPKIEPPKATSSTIKCEDKNVNCFYWATIGECQSNSAYMHSNCEASCGRCGVCDDTENRVSCAIWAKEGKCKDDSSNMMKKCKHSCTGCPRPCVDENAECERWASEGECEKNPDWMSAYCHKSCKKCTNA